MPPRLSAGALKLARLLLFPERPSRIARLPPCAGRRILRLGGSASIGEAIDAGLQFDDLVPELAIGAPAFRSSIANALQLEEVVVGFALREGPSCLCIGKVLFETVDDSAEFLRCRFVHCSSSFVSG